jgi:hypothetical protein
MYGSTPAGGPAMDELASREKVEAEWTGGGKSIARRAATLLTEEWRGQAIKWSRLIFEQVCNDIHTIIL